MQNSCVFVGVNCVGNLARSSSASSRLSATHYLRLIDNLRDKGIHESTRKNYHKIWIQFNNFLLRLDYKPKLWEDRVSLFVANLIECKCQSATVKSYISAIRHVLKVDGYQWKEETVVLSSLTRACKLINDKQHTQLPIHYKLLEDESGPMIRFGSSEIDLCAQVMAITNRARNVNTL